MSLGIQKSVDFNGFFHGIDFVRLFS
jgi:hypothetical protein